MRLVGDATVHGLREIDETGPIGFCGTRVDGDPFDADPKRVDCRSCRATGAWRRHAGNQQPGRFPVSGKGHHRRRGT